MATVTQTSPKSQTDVAISVQATPTAAIPAQLSDSAVAAARGLSLTPVDSMLASAAATVRDRNADTFAPYKVRVNNMSSSVDDKTIYHLRTPAEEAALIEELCKQVHQQHKSLKLEGESDEWFTSRLAEGLGKVCTIEKPEFFIPDFDDFPDEEKEGKGAPAFEPCQMIIDLSPKVSKRENHEKTTTVHYANGVVETFQNKKDGAGILKTGERRFSDGTIERGQFFFNESQRTLQLFESGIRLQNGQYTFRGPRLLENNDSAAVIFGFVEIDGKRQLAPLQKISPVDYALFKGSLVDALLQTAQDPACGGIVMQVLTNTDTPIDPKEFFTALLKPDKSGTPPLFTLSAGALVEVLELSQQLHLPIDLNAADPVSKNTLFMQWAGKGHPELTQLMLEMDPRVIQGLAKLARPLFADALLQRKEEEAEMLLKAMSAAGIKLQEPDEWIRKAYRGESDFTDEEFRKLTPQLQQLLYTISNLYCRDAFVGRLNGLGMAAKESFVYPRHIVGPNMNVIDIRRSLGHFLRTMRQEGLLLTREEFSKLDQSKYRRKDGAVLIERVLGRNFIEETAAAQRCPHIKAPKKYIVFDDGQPITIRVNPDQTIGIHNVHTLYADKVPKCKRKLTREQMTQFLTVLGAIGFQDLSQNFHVTENDVQFIDTEASSFKGMPGLYGRLDELYSVMKPEDHEWLKATINAKVAEFDKSEKEVIRELDRQDKLRKAEAEKFGFTHARTFTFDFPSAT